MVSEHFGLFTAECTALYLWQASLYDMETALGLELDPETDQLRCTTERMSKDALYRFFKHKGPSINEGLKRRSICVEGSDSAGAITPLVATALVRLAHFLKGQGVLAEFVKESYIEMRLQRAIKSNKPRDIKFWQKMKNI